MLLFVTWSSDTLYINDLGLCGCGLVYACFGFGTIDYGIQKITKLLPLPVIVLHLDIVYKMMSTTIL